MTQYISDIIMEIQDQWMDINGVTGIGEGEINGEDCILVFVSVITPEVKKTIPRVYKGFPVNIIYSGIIFSL